MQKADRIFLEGDPLLPNAVGITVIAVQICTQYILVVLFS